jgi:hypothetical protein
MSTHPGERCNPSKDITSSAGLLISCPICSMMPLLIRISWTESLNGEAESIIRALLMRMVMEK